LRQSMLLTMMRIANRKGTILGSALEVIWQFEQHPSLSDKIWFSE